MATTRISGRISSDSERGSDAHRGARVFVGVGANLARPRRTLDAAQRALRARPDVHDFRASSLYRTSPVDAGGPDYLNAVVSFETPLAPPALLAMLHGIEDAFGRARPYRNAPRTLDLDLLLYAALVEGPGAPDGGRVVRDPALVVPHPRAHERAFVLEPLAELWPEALIPGWGAVARLRRAVRARGDQRIERVDVTTRRSSAR